MRRPKKGNPELNVVSFCDIVTVAMVALFMVLIIVIDQALRTPIVRPIPLATNTTNAPVYFECRSNQVFYIDREELAQIRNRAVLELKARTGGGEQMLQQAMQQEIGNAFYLFDNSFLMMGIMALQPRPGVQGEPEEKLQEPSSTFFQRMTSLDPDAAYVVYLVRDDSFPAYRAARNLTVRQGLLSGWEYLGRDEVITFEGMFARVKAE